MKHTVLETTDGKFIGLTLDITAVPGEVINLSPSEIFEVTKVDSHEDCKVLSNSNYIIKITP